MEDYLQATTVVDTMLTTFDNPYNPFSDFDSWKKWDEDNGYFTSELLAAVIGNTDDVLDEVEEAQRHAMAMMKVQLKMFGLFVVQIHKHRFVYQLLKMKNQKNKFTPP